MPDEEKMQEFIDRIKMENGLYTLEELKKHEENKKKEKLKNFIEKRKTEKAFEEKQAEAKLTTIKPKEVRTLVLQKADKTKEGISNAASEKDKKQAFTIKKKKLSGAKTDLNTKKLEEDLKKVKLSSKKIKLNLDLDIKRTQRGLTHSKSPGKTSPDSPSR